MTYKEKLIADHPGYPIEHVEHILRSHCPEDANGVVQYPDYCGGEITSSTCERCWNREIPEEKSTIVPDHKYMPVDYVEATENEPIPDEVMEAVVEDLQSPVILDSGDRTEFETGAVRDMREGKGRCDLMPLEVVSRLLNYQNGNHIIHSISSFIEYHDTAHLYGALNTFIGDHYGQTETMLLEAAKHFEEGAKKYGENNWQKGIPVHCYIDSAVRHYLKWLRGDKDEPHDRAFVWNLMCCIWEVDYHKEESSCG